MQTIVEFWRDIVGGVPSTDPAMLEYCFASCAALLVIIFLFKLLFKIIGLLSGKE